MGKFDDIGEYLGRDWAATARSKHEYWQSKTPEERLEAGFQLYQHAREVNPEWPSDEDRQRDLEHHIRMVRLFAQIDEHTSKDT